MPSLDPRIDAYISKAAPFAQPILKHLRKAVHAGCPDVVETVKWSMPAFEYKGPLCGFAAFKAHATFGFWKHALLEKQLPKSNDAMGQFGRLTSIDDLPSERTLVQLVRAAAELNHRGVRVPRPKTAVKPPVKTPADLAAALKKNAKTRANYDALSPSHKREYVEWITDAKGADTRARRIAQAIEWIGEGKPRNWKYM